MLTNSFDSMASRFLSLRRRWTGSSSAVVDGFSSNGFVAIERGRWFVSRTDNMGGRRKNVHAIRRLLFVKIPSRFFASEYNYGRRS